MIHFNDETTQQTVFQGDLWGWLGQLKPEMCSWVSHRTVSLICHSSQALEIPPSLTWQRGDQLLAVSL